MEIITVKKPIFCQKFHKQTLDETLGFELIISQNFEEINHFWQQITPNNNIFLQSDFMRVCMQVPLQDTGQVFGVFLKDNQPQGIIYTQYKNFNLDESRNGKPLDASHKISKKFKEILARNLDINTLICGNLCLTGENGYLFNENISTETSQKLVFWAMGRIKQSLKKQNIDIKMYFVKDFFEKKSALVEDRYTQFAFQPAMLLQIRAEWLTFDDYLLALHAKARARVKRAIKKSAELTKKELNLDEIKHYEKEIHTLYTKISDNADFNLYVQQNNSSSILKQYLGDKFKLTAYFDNVDNQPKLVGFCTTIENYGKLEAGFIGFEYSYNASHQIYLSMLYEILNIGIKSKSKSINYGRTATEIKSSLGADAFEMYCYLRHTNVIFNALTPYLVDYIDKPEVWQPRHPFLENTENKENQQNNTTNNKKIIAEIEEDYK